MAISQKDYNDLKRVLRLSKKNRIQQRTNLYDGKRFEGRTYNDFGPVHIDEVKSLLWNKIKPEEYEEPPEDWIHRTRNIDYGMKIN